MPLSRWPPKARGDEDGAPLPPLSVCRPPFPEPSPQGHRRGPRQAGGWWTPAPHSCREGTAWGTHAASLSGVVLPHPSAQVGGGPSPPPLSCGVRSHLTQLARLLRASRQTEEDRGAQNELPEGLAES